MPRPMDDWHMAGTDWPQELRAAAIRDAANVVKLEGALRRLMAWRYARRDGDVMVLHVDVAAYHEASELLAALAPKI